MNGPWGAVLVIGLISIMPGIMIYKSFTALPSRTIDEFSEKFSCPNDSITSKKRPDVDVAQFEKAATPPPEVAADPARLAVWKSHQPGAWDVDFFELEGCGHHVLWGCRLPSSKSSAGVHVFCPYTRDLK